MAERQKYSAIAALREARRALLFEVLHLVLALLQLLGELKQDLEPLADLR